MIELVGSPFFWAFLQLLISVSAKKSTRILIDFIGYAVLPVDFPKTNLLH
jgi:hypothetical protein